MVCYLCFFVGCVRVCGVTNVMCNVQFYCTVNVWSCVLCGVVLLSSSFLVCSIVGWQMLICICFVFVSGQCCVVCPWFFLYRLQVAFIQSFGLLQLSYCYYYLFNTSLFFCLYWSHATLLSCEVLLVSLLFAIVRVLECTCNLRYVSTFPVCFGKRLHWLLHSLCLDRYRCVLSTFLIYLCTCS